MRAAFALVAGALTLFASMPAAAASGDTAEQAVAAPAPEWKPFVNLFGQKPAPKKPSIDWNWPPSAGQNPAAKPSVVCGMTVIPADPKVDPKMRVIVPDRGVAFTMRVVQPTVCKAP